MLQNKKILIAISGSIAAYKAILLVRLLVKAGAEVKVIMTPAAKDFVSPLVLSTLSKNEVLVDLFAENSWANHVALGRWADVMVIAPLSCNTLSKMANGACDNLLLSVYLSATCPVVVAPAMDEDMWHHPATKKNLATIQSFGNMVLQPGKGELASGLFGDGRMEEPEAIALFIENFLSGTDKDLAGKNILITAGPTHEMIDPVRFIGNHSSGKMGIAIARECAARGGKVTLVLGPVTIPASLDNIRIVSVQSADEMYQACVDTFATSDIAIMTAAVADYKVDNISTVKIKKSTDDLQLSLTKNKDILKSLGALKQPHQTLVGFALETNNELEYAWQKLQQKNADFIVLNSLKDGNMFGHDDNTITIIGKNNFVKKFETKPKTMVAKDILDTVLSAPN